MASTDNHASPRNELAALVPEPGKSFQEQAQSEPDIFASTWGALAARQATNDDGSTWWPTDAAIETFYHDCDPSVAETAAGRLRAQHWTVANEICPWAGRSGPRANVSVSRPR